MTDSKSENKLSMHMPSSQQRMYDIILYGATSFVGQLTAAYLAQHLADLGVRASHPTLFNDKQNITWAIAGRNLEKLKEVRKRIDEPELPIIIADSNEPDSLDTMVKQCRIIISTVGPYLHYGEPLIKACVEQGTDYVDLTGEAIFIKEMMDKYSSQAKQTHARIINSCGFDSIPSDLGVYFTQMQAYAQFEQYCDTIHMRVESIKGSLSGGTIASLSTIFAQIGKDKSLRNQLQNPYLLNDDSDPPRVKQTSIKTPIVEKNSDRWLAPFIMEGINTRIVHRSNQNLAYLYGRNFKYDEAWLMPSGYKGAVMSYAMTAGIAGFAAAMSFKPSRKLLNQYVLPKSGDGPSIDSQQNGYFDIRFRGIINGHSKIETKVSSDKDPGYSSTCRMLAQTALCLLQDVSKVDVAGGFWTPASALGESLLTRLESYADINFEVISLEARAVALQ